MDGQNVRMNVLTKGDLEIKGHSHRQLHTFPMVNCILDLKHSLSAL